MGAGLPNPSPRELLLSNRTWFSFFERILRVRAGDPGLRPPPADPQPLERVADGLQADPLGRDPVLGADLGGQGQGPGGAGLAELPRALVQERLQPLAALGIEEL